MMLRSCQWLHHQHQQQWRWLSGASHQTDMPVAALEHVCRTLLGTSDADVVALTHAQRRAVTYAVDGFSVFLHLPTGAGKSLCFQAPALLAPPGKTTVVVSPLIALMHDQVAGLKRKGVNAIQVSSDSNNNSIGGYRASAMSTAKPRLPLAQRLVNQRLIYTTPEFLLQNREMREWIHMAATANAIDRVVLDEAHCVLEWGHSFRPSYLELSGWKLRYLPRVPMTLATASVADEDIAALAQLFQLHLCSSSTNNAMKEDQMILIQDVTDRPNLRIEVERKHSYAAASPAARIAQRVKDASTIVYCLTRKEAEDVCLALVRLGCHAGVYHGGLPRKRREFVRKQWMGGQLSIICATSAFGMGIDRSDVRFVVHHSLPLSLSAYSQQIGRAGRDGQHAVCLLLYADEDKARANALTTERDEFDTGVPTFMTAGSSREDLEEVVAFCELAGECRKEMLFSHFGFPFNSNGCNRNCNCNTPLEEAADTAWVAEDSFAPQRFDGDINVTEAASVNRRGEIEYYFQKVLTETKKLRLPKREGLSRRVILEILEKEPSTVEEMAAMRGVGAEKARRYFSLFRS